jgi:hypothetical protein
MVRRIAVPALLLPLIAVGCGGGSEGTTTHPAAQRATQPASKQQLVEVGDAICANHQSRREDLESQARELGPLSSAAKTRRVANLLREESSNLRDEAGEIEGRDSPDAAALSPVLSAIRARARAIDRWARAYEELDERAIRGGQIRVGLLTAAAQEKARGYGFLVCGS